MEYDIFISYSNKDKEIVHKYAQYLQDIGYKVWYDVKGLYTGAKFSEEIVTAIENSKLFIFFSSKNSNSSDWTRGEIHTAKKYNKPILPIKMDAEEYDKSIMLVLLPLQYVVINNNFQTNSCNELLLAIEKFIGLPSLRIEDNQNNDTLSYPKIRDNSKVAFIYSVVASIFFSLFMMIISGEYWMNYSLAFFTTVVSSLCCIVTAAYIVFMEVNWNERNLLQNITFINAVLFFMSYTILAFGLCFVSMDVFLLNSPSIICSSLAIYSLFMLMTKKKFGYKLLWGCAAMFTIGSYWWLREIPETPYVIAILSVIGMSTFRHILKLFHKGNSYWNRLS